MTTPLFLDDAYQRSASAQVIGHTPEGGIILDQSIFYPAGGGQPGDSGMLEWGAGGIQIGATVKGHSGEIILVPAAPEPLPPIGQRLEQHLDWERRHKLMRVHTALHLLSVAVPFGVTGGSISATHGRLDFDMPDAPQDKLALSDALNAMISRDIVVSQRWISLAELDANPAMVKTMAVKPPRTSDRIRLVEIGQGEDQIDTQPCGGTHVARLGEIGGVTIGKIEKKGRMNRRVYLHLDP